MYGGVPRAALLASPPVDVRELGIEGAWEFTPRQHSDDRGVFLEAFTASSFAEAVGHGLDLAQMNLSVSRRGTIRGVHYADVPPSQAKYVQCVHGAVLDVVVDIRVGSPTYGAHEAVLLDGETRRAVYVSEGLGHAFCALTDDAAVLYACSEPYAPGREHGVHPLDPALALPWPEGLELLLSDKDAAAPTLADAADAGALPSYDVCRSYRRTLLLRHRPPGPSSAE